MAYSPPQAVIGNSLAHSALLKKVPIAHAIAGLIAREHEILPHMATKYSERSRKAYTPSWAPRLISWTQAGCWQVWLDIQLSANAVVDDQKGKIFYI